VEVLFLLGRQHEAYGDLDTAMICWEQALRCNDPNLDGELSVAVEERHRTGAALAQAVRQRRPCSPSTLRCRGNRPP
jgi:hypothetical protein